MAVNAANVFLLGFWITLFALLAVQIAFISAINEKEITSTDARTKFIHAKNASTGIMFLFVIAFIYLAGYYIR